MRAALLLLVLQWQWRERTEGGLQSKGTSTSGIVEQSVSLKYDSL